MHAPDDSSLSLTIRSQSVAVDFAAAFVGLPGEAATVRPDMLGVFGWLTACAAVLLALLALLGTAVLLALKCLALS